MASHILRETDKDSAIVSPVINTDAETSRWFLRLAYNGTPFHGWQSQPNALGVQSVIEEALSKVLRTPTSIVGAGRTDTGVHAREMFAHFDCTSPISDPDKFVLSLNRMCGKDIAIYDLLPVIPTAHARFDAVKRTYRYYVLPGKSPFSYPFAWECRRALNVENMNLAAKILLEVSDFTSFAKLHSDAKTNICKVSHARWTQESLANPELTGMEMLVFTISADRFLRNMVRAVVGTLVDVGYGKISIDDFKEIIEKKDRCSAGTSMPAQALFLEKIVYPKEIFIPR